MVKIIVAPDSFKESLDAVTAATAIEAGIKSVQPSSDVVPLPIADGGEGTVAALVTAGGGEYISKPVTGPLGSTTTARWGMLPGKVAVIEMAAASGLPLVPSDQRNPLYTTTLGTGQLIKAALDEGCTRIILGLGGSATNDGGAGALTALGAKLLNSQDREIPSGAQGLLELAKIDISNIDPRVGTVPIEIACDVDNPLLGPRGAARVYGPQKGADPNMVQQMEAALARLARLAQKDLGRDIASFAGSGAAGGLAAGLSLVAPINLSPGIDLVLETMNFDQHLSGASMVITAEGKIDAQSAMGKAISGVAQRARKRGIPVFALCGTVGQGHEAVYQQGISAVIPIVDGPMCLDQAMARTADLLAATSRRLMEIRLA